MVVGNTALSPLRWLDFDFSEDGDGTGTFDALASVRPADRDALAADLVRVLDWAYTRFPGPRGPVGEGGEWDHDLQLVECDAPDATLRYDADARRVVWPADAGDAPRLTVALTLSGTDAFCEALRAAFGLDDRSDG